MPKLIAYALLDDPKFFAIEPAEVKRTWMDETPNQFAYRCLPLNMANQAGWVIRCPVGFKVVWNGRHEPYHGLQIEIEPGGSRRMDSLTSHRIDTQSLAVADPGTGPIGPDAADYIKDHFGNGILTFSLPYLFRTEPGYGLMVRGPTNSWVKNAYPLDGLVETDWLESSFTMNWKIVEPRVPTAFAKGDPICLIHPFPMDLLESIEPKIVPFREEPELQRRFHEWTANRSGFIDKPRTPKEWQKDYFQGTTVDGRESGTHRTKFRLRPFH